jgi:cytochrome c oxidase subunit 2
MLSWWLPENVSTYGADIDWLFHLIYYITAITFVLVAVAMIWFLIRYRASPGGRAIYTHGNTMLEIAWTVAPAVILIVLTFLSLSAWARIKADVPDSETHIRITGKQFQWKVRYPGPDGAFDTADDKEFLDEVHLPVGRPVVFHLTAEDVIHSMFVPSFRFKQDAVPGREILEWVAVTKPGKYEMPCAELCGFGHSGMRGWVYAHTPEEYAEWVAANVNVAADGDSPPPSETPSEPATEPSSASGTSERSDQ